MHSEEALETVQVVEVVTSAAQQEAVVDYSAAEDTEEVTYPEEVDIQETARDQDSGDRSQATEPISVVIQEPVDTAVTEAVRVEVIRAELVSADIPESAVMAVFLLDTPEATALWDRSMDGRLRLAVMTSMVTNRYVTRAHTCNHHTHAEQAQFFGISSIHFFLLKTLKLPLKLRIGLISF